MTVGGVVGAFYAKAAADSDAYVDELISSMRGGMWAAQGPDYTAAWVSGVVAFLGAIMLIAALVIRAKAEQDAGVATR